MSDSGKDWGYSGDEQIAQRNKERREAKAQKEREQIRDDEMPEYEIITGWLQRVPMTWLPDLFFRICVLCIMRGVFQAGGMERVIERAKSHAARKTT